MATLRFNSLTGVLEKKPTSSFSPNPKLASNSLFCNEKGEKRVSRMAVKAKYVSRMAVKAKYKGTQTREKNLTEMIEQKVLEAKQVCQGDDTSDECKVAWDKVEEVSQAKADLRLRLQIESKDPLESFCLENPETEECRIYED